MASSCSLSREDIGRYGRQLILPEWGVKGIYILKLYVISELINYSINDCAGQMCLKSTSVLVVGVGGLGCPMATYLAAAGIGETISSSIKYYILIHYSPWLAA